MENIKRNSWENAAFILCFIGLGLGLLILLLAFSNNLFKSNTTFDHTVFSSIGSYVGGVAGSLFGGATFILVYLAYKAQKEELQKTEEALRLQVLESKEQNKTLTVQRFENTFFSLLSLHHRIIEGFETIGYGMGNGIGNPPTLKGRASIKYHYEILVKNFNDIDTLHDLEISYNRYYKEVQTDFSHYFRNLYRIIKLVHETEFISANDLPKGFSKAKYEEENYKVRYSYTSIIRSQLSDYELLWLFYNCLSHNGNTKFKPLIEHYSLLKNLPKNLLHNETIWKEYLIHAFDQKSARRSFDKPELINAQ
ncbi:putative phage abortive infection protein [Sporocytophaga myxococcoides]|uniref:putative phage abortive infection protein n=1 Tax=Sporocytophaga myxococcoides TaxID=153721 RepID=UPI000425A3E5|nr:putative phage abortive infection protein [Sporocytophaga myxococcoides]